MAEDEVAIELEAAEAVYGDDCVVLEKYPPHLQIHIKPRTADVSSQQFVEVFLAIRAGPQYPDEPPDISIVDSKGLDEQRQKHLITSICNRAFELSSCLMLVALCEEAVEKLSSMNHPEGDCPLCLSPLVEEDAAGNNVLPFMKLMSCFHCFHCECIIRWWNWLQTQKETDLTSSSGPSNPRVVERRQGLHGLMEKNIGTCPVCRKLFSAKDIEHVLDLVGTHSHLDSDESGVNEDEKLLHSDSENIRRQKYEAILKLQQENSCLIEPKTSEVLMPGMFVTRTMALPTTASDKEATEQQDRDLATSSETNSTGPTVRPKASEQKNSGFRKNRGRDSRKPAKQWIKKEE